MADKRDIEYAGFWVRVWAAVLDLLIFVLTTAPLFYAIYGRWYLRLAVTERGPIDFLNSFVLANVLLLLFWFVSAATPGKMACSLRIIDLETGLRPKPGQFMRRFFGLYLAALPLGLGLLWVAFSPKKQGWHDKLAGTAVVRVKK